jgi:hypothetical protein
VLNFNSDVDTARRTKGVHTHRAEVPEVQERVIVTPISEVPEPAPVPEPVAEKPVVDATASTGSFEWEKVRDYVVGQILALHGPFPRDTKKENTIFMHFLGRWEDLSMSIAKYAFEKADGMWLDAPVSVARFHKTSDPVFAQKIAAQI